MTDCAVVILQHRDDTGRSLAQGNKDGLSPPMDAPSLVWHPAVVLQDGVLQLSDYVGAVVDSPVTTSDLSLACHSNKGHNSTTVNNGPTATMLVVARSYHALAAFMNDAK